MSISDNNKVFSISRYNDSLQEEWDEFVSKSINGTFLFNRSFMDYHADRFFDNSFIIREKQNIIAVFVAGVNKETDNKILIAHPGLTYGGLVHKENLKYYEIEKILDLVINTARSEGYKKLVIKPVSKVFCSIYSDSHKFFFNKRNFDLNTVDANSVIDLENEIIITKARKKNLRKANSLGLQVIESDDCEPFYNIMVSSLEKSHGVIPVHSLAELKYLMHNNPNNIKHYQAVLDNEVVGGTILFVDKGRGFVHTQYTHANDIGKNARAIDAMVMNTIEKMREQQIKKMSFGISTVRGELNTGLLSQKEDFGSVMELTEVYSLSL